MAFLPDGAKAALGLQRASGPCWQDEFAALHPMSWGNLICSHRPDVLDVLKQKSLGPERGPPG
jgi:hypothetical protein